MGFRSTLVTEDDYGIQWPQWFRDKYAKTIMFREDCKGPLSSTRETKAYADWDELPQDIQRVIDWGRTEKFILVYLHECGGITRVKIQKDAIKWSEPSGWKETEGVDHHYCYGCSDL